MKADSTESALNRGLRALPLLISTYIFAIITARKTNHIQASGGDCLILASRLTPPIAQGTVAAPQ